MLLIAMSRVMGSAAKTAPELKIMHVRKRHRASPTLFGRAGAAGGGAAGGDCVFGAYLFMMDVRMLLLIIGVGRKAPCLE
jgi:hypothetical protein